MAKSDSKTNAGAEPKAEGGGPLGRSVKPPTAEAYHAAAAHHAAAGRHHISAAHELSEGNAEEARKHAAAAAAHSKAAHDLSDEVVLGDRFWEF